MDACKLDVLFFRDREKDVWVGQCLQYDIAVQAENLRECMQELRSVLLGRIVIAAELKMEHPFENVPPAPAKYWKHYQDAFKLCPDEPTFQFPEGVPPAFMLRSSDLEIRIYG